ncbi:methionyl-tRNA formyltransferase [Pleionea sediminis]|uniref:methionyl-tRNA formyltransferase n=1 Tax=Pleionea sediminis TaxID=2569479 RepID=UPI00118650EC|nr:methionyl-tRNA formyltransferase [Pleionea sediminis]
MPQPRIVFAGTPDFAATCFQHLLDAGYNIVATYTQPDRPAGRGKKLQPSPVKKLAQTHGISVEQPLNFKNPQDIQRLNDYQPDLMIVVAYGLLLPQAVLDIPKLGCINIHASLLPKWRGAAPIQRAIEAGDSETGVGIMQMEAGLDTGPLWAEARCEITENETGSSLHDKLATLGGKTLIQTLPTILSEKGEPTPQSDGAIYAHKLNKSEALLDWSQSAKNLERKVRAFNSWPVAFFKIDNQPYRVWEACSSEALTNEKPGTILSADKNGITIACGEGCLTVKSVQPPGKRAMSAADLLNSRASLFEVSSIIGE